MNGMNDDQDEKTVLVTGVSSGVGAAVAAELKKAAATVIGIDIKPPTTVVGQFLEADLSDPRSVRDIVKRLPGKLDSLINVAGIPGPEPRDKVMAVNFLGARLLTELLFDRLSDGGSVVNVASVAGRDWLRRADVIRELLATDGFEAGMQWCNQNQERWAKDPYTFSKQCLVAYTLLLAGRGLQRRIRVNAISPGAITTPLSPFFRQQVGEAQFDWSVAQIGRQATPAEIAEVISFAAIGKCRWLNGADIIVDGGLVAGLLTGWVDAASSPAAKARQAKSSARA